MKAEKSHMQEMWDDISEQESLYKKLWSFGVRSLRSHERGLYEAADILLGDHLSKKSDSVQWISIERPKNRKVRIKSIKNYSSWLNQIQILIICMKQTSLITFIQIGQLLLVKFVPLTVSNGIVEVTTMQMVEDNMSDLENLKFLITEYTIQISDMRYGRYEYIS